MRTITITKGMAAAAAFRTTMRTTMRTIAGD